MPPVGPQLPPHLAKRKRSIDDDNSDDSAPPPTKIHAASPVAEPQPRRVLGPALPPQQAHNNEDEITLSDSDDGELGPSLPASQMPPPEPKSRRVMGPAPPPAPPNERPSKPASNGEEIPLDDSDDDLGPSLPSTLANKPKPAPSRVLGPTPPPAPLSERPPQPANAADSDSSDDDDYGPSLPPAPGSAAAYAAEAQRAQEASRLQAAAANAEPAKPKRADWMLVPPTDSDWSSRVDPTKLKNRKFASGKGGKAPGEKSGISAIWTETPEEKRQRLEDEVLGRREQATSSMAGRRETSGKDDGEQEAIARRIREYNEKNRGRSLVDEHSGKAGGGKEKEDDPSKRGFDKEKDMGLGGRINHVQKKDMLKRAGDFGQRFERGKFL